MGLQVEGVGFEVWGLEVAVWGGASILERLERLIQRVGLKVLSRSPKLSSN